MKRTLKRECKGLEIAKREAAAGSTGSAFTGAARVSISCRRGNSSLGRYIGPALAGVRCLNPGSVPCWRLRSKCLTMLDEMPVPDPS
jgi:hypothetical protein